MAGLAEAGDGLVHDAAVAADVLVFGALADLGQFHAVDLVVAEHVVQGEGKGALQSGARTHAGTEGHVTCEGGVEALYGNAQSHHLAANAVDVASPCGVRSLFVVEREFHFVLQVDGVGADVAGAVGL